ncbi:MAG: hypothetical protein ABIO16_10585 [Nocardioides sp.]
MRSPSPAVRLAGPALLLTSALPGPAGDVAFVGALAAFVALTWALGRVARHRRPALLAAGLATVGAIGLVLADGVLGTLSAGAFVAGVAGALGVLAVGRQVSLLEPVLALVGLGITVLDRGLVALGALLVGVALARGPEIPGAPVPERVSAPPGR